MIEKDSLTLSKFAIDPQLEIDFDSYEDLDSFLIKEVRPAIGSIDLYDMDDDFLMDS